MRSSRKYIKKQMLQLIKIRHDLRGTSEVCQNPPLQEKLTRVYYTTSTNNPDKTIHLQTIRHTIHATAAS